MSTQHPITIYVGPGETINQALIRAVVMSPPEYGPIEALTIPPGVKIINPKIERRTSGIPFLCPENQP